MYFITTIDYAFAASMTMHFYIKLIGQQLIQQIILIFNIINVIDTS